MKIGKNEPACLKRDIKLRASSIFAALEGGRSCDLGKREKKRSHPGGKKGRHSSTQKNRVICDYESGNRREHGLREVRRCRKGDAVTLPRCLSSHKGKKDLARRKGEPRAAHWEKILALAGDPLPQLRCKKEGDPRKKKKHLSPNQQEEKEEKP